MAPSAPLALSGGMTNPSPPPPPPPPATEPGPAPQAEQQGPRTTRNEALDLGRLRRSTDERRVAGVAAGLARHLDIDPIIVRVALVVLVFFGGAGLLLYAAVWLLVPEEGSPGRPLGLDDRNRSIALAGTGILAALAAVGNWAGAFWFPWPLVIVGLFVVWFLTRRQKGPQAGPLTWPQTAHGSDATYPPPIYHYARPRNPRRRGPLLFWFTLALIATGVGTLGVIDVAGTDVPDAAYPALGLALTGAMLVLGAFWGRAGGLILVGLVLAVATLAATATEDFTDTRLVYAPTTASQVSDDYTFDGGELMLDLSAVDDVAGLDGRQLRVEGGIGGIEVIVPAGVDVSLDASTGVGQIESFGRTEDGLDVSVDSFLGGGDGVPELRIIIDLGVGQVTVREQ